MTVARLLSPALRSGLLIWAGTALITVPLVISLRPAAMVTGVAVGGIAVALGVAGTGTGTESRGSLPVSAQAFYDRGLALGLLAVGVLFGSLGDHWSLLLFGGAGLAALLVTVTTRYTGGPV